MHVSALPLHTPGPAAGGVFPGLAALERVCSGNRRSVKSRKSVCLQGSVWPLPDVHRVNAVWSRVDPGRGPRAARWLLPRDGKGPSRQKPLQGQLGASGTIDLCPEQKLRIAVGDQGLWQEREQNSDHEESTVLLFHRNVTCAILTAQGASQLEEVREVSGC